MSIQERLKMVMKMNNLSAAAFADKVGVQRSSISHVMSGRNKPSLDFIQKTLIAFPRVNGDWLVSGRPAGSNEKQSEDIGTESAGESERAEYRAEKYTEGDTSKKESLNIDKKVNRIVIFYNNGTFEETFPKD